jgi:hypothetical protein
MRKPDVKTLAREWLAALRDAGHRIRLDDAHGVRMAFRAWDSLTDAQRQFWERNHRVIKDVLVEERIASEPRGFHALLANRSKPAPAPRKPTADEQPQPSMLFRGEQITEEQVRQCLALLGDETVASYERGDLSKLEAYATTREWLRNCYSFRHLSAPSPRQVEQMARLRGDL